MKDRMLCGVDIGDSSIVAALAAVGGKGKILSIDFKEHKKLATQIN